MLRAESEQTVGNPGRKVARLSDKPMNGLSEIGLVEVRAGIEPAFEDLQSSASPLCHRTPVAWRGGGGLSMAGRAGSTCLVRLAPGCGGTYKAPTSASFQ